MAKKKTKEQVCCVQLKNVYCTIVGARKTRLSTESHGSTRSDENRIGLGTGPDQICVKGTLLGP